MTFLLPGRLYEATVRKALAEVATCGTHMVIRKLLPRFLPHAERALGGTCIQWRLVVRVFGTNAEYLENHVNAVTACLVEHGFTLVEDS